MRPILFTFCFAFSSLLAALAAPHSFAACTGTTLQTWDGSNSISWNKAQNWTSSIPDVLTEEAVIVAAARVCSADTSETVGCVDVQSGLLRGITAGVTLAIKKDYFKALTANTLDVSTGTTFTIDMAGTAAQTFSVVDPINYLTISNPTNVTFTNPFVMRNSLNITGAGTTVYMNADLNMSDTSTSLTIPAGRTVEVGAGAVVTLAGGALVYGTLKLNPGSKIVIGSGKTLDVKSTGALQLNGASGNVATVEASSGSFTFNVAGSLSANYFRVNRPAVAGMNLTGTLSQLDNGEFHFLASAGVGITIASTASVPATMTGIGFYDDSSFGNVKNVDATGYNGAATTINNWTGLGGGANEKADPNNKVGWGSAASTQLTISNNTVAGSPPTTINPNVGPSYFATFAFNLTQADLYTDITQVTLTQYGTGTSSDVSTVQVFRDISTGGTNCVYDAAVDQQIGSNLTFSGSPPTTTVTIPTSYVRTNGSAPACIHVLMRTSNTAADNNTIGARVALTTDVTNVKADTTSYTFSSSSGPPVSAGTSTITSTYSNWDGSSSTAWATAANWTPATIPSSTRDCTIGSGVRVPALGGNRACRNVTLASGGQLDFGSVTNQLQAYGSLIVNSAFTFVNAATGDLRLMGTSNQSLDLGTSFPGTLTVANTGNATINVDGNSFVAGNITVTQGTLKINDTFTLTALGNITVQTGATLEIAPGGTLAMASGKTLTINTGGTLKMIGTASKTSKVTLASGSTGYNVVVDGTIQAQYYTFSKMGLAGIAINSGATIDATYHLQDGNFNIPMANSTVMLLLNRQVPGNALSNMSFDAAGSTATTVTNIKTVAAAGTLTVTTYSGSWSGPSYESAPTYLISWTGATNTINLTQEAVGPSTVNQGSTYTMGRFGFTQTQAGASYLDTDITSLKLTLIGTGTAGDISAVRAYFDSGCTGTGGTLLGTGTFSGNPATVTFSGLTGATIPMNLTTPPKRCIYVQYDISGTATNSATVGVKIAANGDVVNSQSYGISGGTPPPVTLGTAASIIGSSTTWTGATDTTWCTAANWNGGVPTASLNCAISNVTNLPVISGTCAGVTPVCKSLTINSGSLTMNAGTTLEVYGSFTNNGTFNQGTGTLKLRDDGVNATNQTISSSAGSFGTVTFNKTAAGGTAQASGSAVTITNLTIPAGSNFEWIVPSSQTLTLPNGVAIPAGKFTINGGGTAAIGNGQSITVSGGTFKVAGTNDAYPQTTTNKGKVTVSGAGTWGFSASSGTVDLTGFLFDYINTSGLNLSGTTTLSNLNGGQFTHLSTSYSSVRAIQLNNTGGIPATATNIGWNWGAANSTYNNPPSPLSTDAYNLVTSSGCASQSISFDQWFGDFFIAVNNPLTSTKVSATACTVVIAASASPVAITSLTATPYASAVSIDWETVSEIDHSGFNVYRSTNPVTGFIQINATLIRNVNTSGLAHGIYRYLDEDVTNGVTYYYRVEDVAINGGRMSHGPVAAAPDLLFAAAPAAAAGTNTGNSSPGAGVGNDPTAGVIATPDLVDLGNGVHILAQTRSSLRIEIVPPAAVFAASSWNAAYETVTLPGYASSTDVGKPELVERTLLIEVDNSQSTATLSNATVTEAAIVNHQIAPAPAYTQNGAGVLMASRNPGAAAYAMNSYFPAQFYDVSTTLEIVSSRKYLRIKVNPFLYNAASRQLRRATKIVLDIGLDGSAWSAPSPSDALAVSPSAVEGTLRIRYNKTGIYELSYADIAAAGLEGFFAGTAISDFRLYLHGNETPLEVVSAGATFASGDKLRFYLPFEGMLEDTDNEAVLSRVALNGAVNAPLRMAHLDGTPGALPLSNEQGTYMKTVAEQDLMFIQDLPLGDGVDHFYWSRIYALRGSSLAPANTKHDITVNLPNLIQNASQPVNLKLAVRGRGSVVTNPIHHIGIYVNQVNFMVADSVFVQEGPVVLDLNIPASYFAPGINTIRVQVLADMVPAGEYDVVDIDKLELWYRSVRAADVGVAEFYSYRPGQVVTVNSFAVSGVNLYDVTNPDSVAIVDNALITANGSEFDATFATNVGAGGNGFHYIGIEPSAYLKPAALLLGRGVAVTLKSTALGADLLIVGPSELLEAAADLVAARRAEGLRVVTAPLDQIYAEFSDGLKSSQAIRDLILYARANWQAPAPQYLMLLGDATYDPRDRLGNGSRPNAMPMPLEKGTYTDFGNDNWFVASADGSGTPTMAVGRVPASTAIAVSDYVRKILSYEAGTRAPQGSMIKQMVFVSDADTMSEGFASKANELATTVIGLRTDMDTPKIDRAALGSDAATRTAILDSFNEGPFVISYVGHGAENLWADAAVFSNDEAAALTNNDQPIVLALNCLNSYFYDADPTRFGLGEKLVLNGHGGAIAFWGSTTLTNPIPQMKLAQAFFDQLARETTSSAHTVRIGDLTHRAKITVGLSAATLDAIKSYTLIGDPTIKLPASAFTPTPASAPSSGSGGASHNDRGGAGCGSIMNHGDNGDGP